jgi:hypothetical protein
MAGIFITVVESVYSAVRTDCLYRLRLVFKWLNEESWERIAKTHDLPNIYGRNTNKSENMLAFPCTVLYESIRIIANYIRHLYPSDRAL